MTLFCPHSPGRAESQPLPAVWAGEATRQGAPGDALISADRVKKCESFSLKMSLLCTATAPISVSKVSFGCEKMTKYSGEECT